MCTKHIEAKGALFHWVWQFGKMQAFREEVFIRTHVKHVKDKLHQTFCNFFSTATL